MINATALFFTTLVTVSPDGSQDFAAANERALAKDYVQAEALYRAIIERGVEDPDIYFNLGHVLESAGQDIDAIVAYEHALSLDPHDEDARYNLEQLRHRILPKASEPNPDAISLADALKPFAARSSTLTIVGWLSALFVLGGSLLRSTGHHRAFTVSVGLWIGAGFGISWLILSALASSDERAVVIRNTDLRDGPDPRFGTRGQVRAGESVRVRDEGRGFKEVQRADGTIGFVAQDALELLRPRRAESK